MDNISSATTDSPFIRFEHGNKLIIPPNILEGIEEFLSKGKPAKELIVKASGFGGSFVAPESTWFGAINELLRFEEEKRIDPMIIKRRKTVIMRILDLIVKTNRTSSDIWVVISTVIRDEADVLSGWEFSHIKTMAEAENIQRTPEGKYESEKDGQISEWQGLKTLCEEKSDYVISSLMGRYGDINGLIKFSALVFIALDYASNPNFYHPGVKCALYDDEHGHWTSYLHWTWHVEHLYQIVSFYWHPRTCFTDPQWLQSDLFRMLSEKWQEEAKVLPKFEKPEVLQKWDEAFNGHPHQYSLALDTKIVLGREDEDEVYFDFMGKKLRWINGTKNVFPVLVVPADTADFEEARKIARRFISYMVKEVRCPIRELSSVGSAARPGVAIQQPRSWGMIGFPDAYLYQTGGKEASISEKEWQALALYKEGMNAESVLYGFLNYYKVLEIMFGSSGKQMEAGISNVLPKLGFSDWEKKITQLGETPSHYLHEYNRHAIAHTRSNKSPQANPDDMDDVNRIRESMEVVRRMAEVVIDEERLKNGKQ